MFIIDQDQARVSCGHCGAQIWAYTKNWQEGLKEDAIRFGWRLEIDLKNLNNILCECENHRTDLVKKYSYKFNDRRKHQGGDNISSSGWYGPYKLLKGKFSLQELPTLLYKLFPWSYGGNGGWEARGLELTPAEISKILEINRMPSRSIEIINCY